MLRINRPLFFDFPEDPNVWEIKDVYMFGPTMLAAPVRATDRILCVIIEVFPPGF